jgi:hypothetical protein
MTLAMQTVLEVIEDTSELSNQSDLVDEIEESLNFLIQAEEDGVYMPMTEDIFETLSDSLDKLSGVSDDISDLVLTLYDDGVSRLAGSMVTG